MFILFISLLVFIFLGVPVGFSIGLSVLTFMWFGLELPVSIVVQRMIGGINSFPLLALPLFILAGILMEKGSTPRLVRFADSLLGFMSGGLGVVTVAASAFFGSISGSGVATTAAIGSIMAPEMVKRGYSKGFAASTVAASGGLGILIPPSITMVIFGITGGVSVGALLVAGIIPGLITALLLCITVVILAKRLNYGGGKKSDLTEIWSAFKGAILPLLMPIIILGGILGGIFTPTEAAAVGVFYAFILGFFVYKELQLKDIPQIMNRAVISSSIILFIMSASNPFAWIVATEQVPQQLSNLLLSISSSPLFILVTIQLIMIVLGTFMETTAIIIITTPIFLPIVIAAGMDPLVYGVVMTLNLIIGGATPPLAVGLYTATSILGIGIEETVRYLIPFILTLMLSMIINAVIPELSLALPQLLLDYK